MNVLVPMLPAIGAALSGDGEAILSGILVAEREEMLDALRSRGWKASREDSEEAWWSVQVTPP